MSDQHHDLAIQYGTSPKTFNSCVIGFVGSLLITLIAFAIVWEHTMSTAAMYSSLSVLAIFQLITQVVFFLRMNASKEGRWNLLPFLFTLVIVAILLGGSLWIMYNLNYNMMH